MKSYLLLLNLIIPSLSFANVCISKNFSEIEELYKTCSRESEKKICNCFKDASVNNDFIKGALLEDEHKFELRSNELRSEEMTKLLNAYRQVNMGAIYQKAFLGASAKTEVLSCAPEDVSEGFAASLSNVNAQLHNAQTPAKNKIVRADKDAIEKILEGEKKNIDNFFNNREEAKKNFYLTTTKKEMIDRSLKKDERDLIENTLKSIKKELAEVTKKHPKFLPIFTKEFQGKIQQLIDSPPKRLEDEFYKKTLFEYRYKVRVLSRADNQDFTLNLENQANTHKIDSLAITEFMNGRSKQDQNDFKESFFNNKRPNCLSYGEFITRKSVPSDDFLKRLEAASANEILSSLDVTKGDSGYIAYLRTNPALQGLAASEEGRKKLAPKLKKLAVDMKGRDFNQRLMAYSEFIKEASKIGQDQKVKDEIGIACGSFSSNMAALMRPINLPVGSFPDKEIAQPELLGRQIRYCSIQNNNSDDKYDIQKTVKDNPFYILNSDVTLLNADDNKEYEKYVDENCGPVLNYGKIEKDPSPITPSMPQDIESGNNMGAWNHAISQTVVPTGVTAKNEKSYKDGQSFIRDLMGSSRFNSSFLGQSTPSTFSSNTSKFSSLFNRVNPKWGTNFTPPQALTTPNTIPITPTTIMNSNSGADLLSPNLTSPAKRVEAIASAQEKLQNQANEVMRSNRAEEKQALLDKILALNEQLAQMKAEAEEEAAENDDGDGVDLAEDDSDTDKKKKKRRQNNDFSDVANVQNNPGQTNGSTQGGNFTNFISSAGKATLTSGGSLGGASAATGKVNMDKYEGQEHAREIASAGSTFRIIVENNAIHDRELAAGDRKVVSEIRTANLAEFDKILGSQQELLDYLEKQFKNDKAIPKQGIISIKAPNSDQELLINIQNKNGGLVIRPVDRMAKVERQNELRDLVNTIKNI